MKTRLRWKFVSGSGHYKILRRVRLQGKKRRYL
jgi:hypothetical protein